MSDFSIHALRERKERYLPHLSETRNHEIARAVMTGDTLSAAAKRFGLSVERVRQITVLAAMKIEFPCTPRLAGTEIERLGISNVRVLHVILNSGISTIAELEAMSDKDLLDLPNFGKKALRDLRNALAAHQASNPSVPSRAFRLGV